MFRMILYRLFPPLRKHLLLQKEKRKSPSFVFHSSHVILLSSLLSYFILSLFDHSLIRPSFPLIRPPPPRSSFIPLIRPSFPTFVLHSLHSSFIPYIHSSFIPYIRPPPPTFVLHSLHSSFIPYIRPSFLSFYYYILISIYLIIFFHSNISLFCLSSSWFMYMCGLVCCISKTLISNNLFIF